MVVIVYYEVRDNCTIVKHPADPFGGQIADIADSIGQPFNMGGIADG